MKSAVLLASLALVDGASLKLAWNDCGAAHGKVTGLTPATLPLGQKTTVTGTGTVDEAVSGGSFEIDLKASIISQKFTGDLCTAKSFPLPLGTGTITWDGLKCPVAVGAVSVPVDIQLSSSLPQPLQNVQMTIKGAGANNADVFCMQVNTSPAELAAKAAQCTDADKKLWDGDAGHSKWQSQMTSCGTKCLGRASCVTSCMQGDGWSSGCAGCFGALAGCTASHCLTKCLGGRTPACVTCLKAAGCDTAAFGANSCTGFDAPSLQLLLSSAPIVV